MKHALNTEIIYMQPWGTIVSARALCPDQVVRKCKRVAQTSDTFFSIPASVYAYGKTIAGYITVETIQGLSTATDADPSVVKFIPYDYCKNGEVFAPYIALKKT